MRASSFSDSGRETGKGGEGRKSGKEKGRGKRFTGIKGELKLGKYSLTSTVKLMFFRRHRYM